MNREQYKTYLRQRLTENLLITEVTAMKKDIDPTSAAGQLRIKRLTGLVDFSRASRAPVDTASSKDERARERARGSRALNTARAKGMNQVYGISPTGWTNNPGAREMYADNSNETRKKMQGTYIHPHTVLTGILAQHFGQDASDVFNETRRLRASSPQEDVDRVIMNMVARHGDGIFDKLSAEPGDPYHTPPARYGGSPERDFDAYDAHNTATNSQSDRFFRDFTAHINDNVRTGVHTEFTGTPRYDGV